MCRPDSVFGALAILFCTLVTAMPVSAQSPTETAPATDYTDFDLGQLTDMDVVYGASSYDQKITDAPAAVTVITAEEIAAHGYRTLGDVLASVRGFHVTYDRSYDYIGVRGFGRPGDYNTRVLVLHDGHTANDIIYGTASAGAELAVDLALVKRIEVIRGPGSALYGAGAFFAVINLVTWDGDEWDATEAGVEYGSRQLQGARAAWGGRVGDKGSLLLAADGVRTDGDDLHFAEYDDPSTNNGLSVDGDREEAGHIFAKYRRGGIQLTANWMRRDKRIPTGEWGMIFDDDGATIRDERTAVDLSGSHPLSDAASVRVRIAYDDYECTGDYPLDNAAEGQPEERVVQHEVTIGRWWSGEIQWNAHLKSHRLVAGVDARRSAAARQSSVIVEPFDSLLDQDNLHENLGVYVQDEWTPSGRVSVYLGLRHDAYRSFGSTLSPRCGLVAHLDELTTVKLLYGEAFRSPNAYELYYGDALSQKGNPDLEPERIHTWEAVGERNLGAHARLGLSVFDNRIEELIEQYIDPVDTLLVFRNAGDARTFGAELDLDARLLPGLRGRLSVSAQRAEDRATGTLLTNAPARLVKLNLSTPRQGKAVAGALEFQHLSRRATLAGNQAPAYALVNLDLTWWTPVRGLQVDLGVDNALDQRYGDPGAEHQLQDVLAREGRRLNARATLRW